MTFRNMFSKTLGTLVLTMAAACSSAPEITEKVGYRHVPKPVELTEQESIVNKYMKCKYSIERFMRSKPRKHFFSYEIDGEQVTLASHGFDYACTHLLVESKDGSFLLFEDNKTEDGKIDINRVLLNGKEQELTEGHKKTFELYLGKVINMRYEKGD